MFKNIFSIFRIDKWKIFKNITYEPTVLLYFISSYITHFLGDNLILRKSCDPTALTEPDLSHSCLNEVLAQQRVTQINSWKIMVRMILATAVALIAGPWSDAHGRRRRPLIFMPIIGHIMVDILLSFTAYFWYVPPELTALIESVLTGISGSTGLLWTGLISYVSDNTGLKDRTWKIGIAGVMYESCSAIGSAVAGFMNVNFGFVGSYLISMLMNVTGLILGIMLIPDTSVTNEKSMNFVNTFYESTRGLYKLVIKKRHGKKRLCFWIVLCAKLLTVGRTFGERGLLYFYVRYKFSWDEIQYGVYVSLKMGATVIGTCMSFGIMSYCLKMNDAMIGIIGAFTDSVAVLLYFFAYEPWHMYVVVIFDIFTGATLGTSTSLLTKCVEPDEQGKMGTLQSLVLLITPVIVGPLYYKLYTITLEIMPNAFFILSAVLLIPTIFLFVIVYNITRKSTLFMGGTEKDNEAQINYSESIKSSIQKTS